MKTAALDIGDVWTGIAISDALGMFARPLQTVQTKDLYDFLATLLTKEPINKVIVGNPKTLKNTSSDQTKKVEVEKIKLEEKFPSVTWILWDERLSSKRANTLKHAKTKQEKIQSHSIAAAFILTSYLEFTHLSMPPMADAQN